jgi:hypothetical protein
MPTATLYVPMPTVWRRFPKAVVATATSTDMQQLAGTMGSGGLEELEPPWKGGGGCVLPDVAVASLVALVFNAPRRPE